jgi:hypothetical protein
MRLGKVVVKFLIREDVRGADVLILEMSDIVTPVNLRLPRKIIWNTGLQLIHASLPPSPA